MNNLPIRVDLPYPSLDMITVDRESACIISPAYASLESEFTAISQYIYHHFQFDFQGDFDNSDLMEGIAMAEMKHLDILGSLLIRLGTNPIMSARPPERRYFFNTSEVMYSMIPQKMLMDNITGEYMAIRMYRGMVARLQNEQVAMVIERIILDEELHLERLKVALATMQSYVV